MRQDLGFELGRLHIAHPHHDGPAGVLAHEQGQGLADFGGVFALLGHHHQRHGAGAQHAGGLIPVLLPKRDPQLGQLVEDPIGLYGRGHYAFLHSCPRRASISSAAFGPQAPAA